MKRLERGEGVLPAYGELAWTEPILSPAESYSGETEVYIKAIFRHSKIKPRTLLHPGCGAGGHDYTFKKRFKVTGVDISAEMLKIARSRNPEAVYHKGDIRNFRLQQSFDAVAVPDSIGYMAASEDLGKALATAYSHLKPGGVLVLTTLVGEDFKENNFIYTGSGGDAEITLFENNHMPGKSGNVYEATLVYLIRRGGRLKIHTDRHLQGLFEIADWLMFLKEAGFSRVKKQKMKHLYDNHIAGRGEYHLTVFICEKAGG